jgi:hypothetical protein
MSRRALSTTIFESRQDLLDQLLPSISERLHDLVRQRVLEAPDDAIEREKARLAGFFEFLEKEPGLYKIISEGTLQAPRGFARISKCSRRVSARSRI